MTPAVGTRRNFFQSGNGFPSVANGQRLSLREHLDACRHQLADRTPEYIAGFF
jgi:hypothetical protein